MFSRTQIALGLAVLIALITSITVFAKGGFAFIAISRSNLNGTVRATAPELTTDFFAFADFFKNRAEAPDSPGEGYDITRFYIDNSRDVAFDHLHYYPETGFVFYDGIVNGSSEYDGKWFTARPEIKTAFEKAVSLQLAAVPAVAEPAADTQPITAADTTQSSPSFAQIRPIILIAMIAGLIVIFAFTIRRRSASTQ